MEKRKYIAKAQMRGYLFHLTRRKREVMDVSIPAVWYEKLRNLSYHIYHFLHKIGFKSLAEYEQRDSRVGTFS